MSTLDIMFREYTLRDIHLLKQIFQNAKVMEYTLDDCFSDENVKSYLHEIVKNNNSTVRKTYEYAVYHEGQYIGFTDFTISQQNVMGGVAEIGYLLLPQYWGKGYGFAVVKKLIEICFITHKLHRVYAKCNTNNLGSKKVLEKNGLLLEGTLIMQRFKHGVWQNEDLYALINPDVLDCK